MTTYLHMRRHVGALVCEALLLPLLGCMREPETALRIGTNVWMGCDPLCYPTGQLSPHWP
jgi:hypothetical protein